MIEYIWMSLPYISINTMELFPVLDIKKEIPD